MWISHNWCGSVSEKEDVSSQDAKTLPGKPVSGRMWKDVERRGKFPLSITGGGRTLPFLYQFDPGLLLRISVLVELGRDKSR